MTPEEIKAKSAELAAFYVAKSNGKTLEYDTQSVGWVDNGSTSGPDMQSDLSRWRVKPEPRRMWETFSAMESKDVGLAPVRVTHTESEAIEWRENGHKVTEWMEVLP
jgi:hypothetical protein